MPYLGTSILLDWWSQQYKKKPNILKFLRWTPIVLRRNISVLVLRRTWAEGVASWAGTLAADYARRTSGGSFGNHSPSKITKINLLCLKVYPLLCNAMFVGLLSTLPHKHSFRLIVSRSATSLPFTRRVSNGSSRAVLCDPLMSLSSVESYVIVPPSSS